MPAVAYQRNPRAIAHLKIMVQCGVFRPKPEPVLPIDEPHLGNLTSRIDAVSCIERPSTPNKPGYRPSIWQDCALYHKFAIALGLTEAFVDTAGEVGYSVVEQIFCGCTCTASSASPDDEPASFA